MVCVMSSVTKNPQSTKVESLERTIKVLRHIVRKIGKELVEEYGGKRMYKRGVPKYNTWLLACKILNRMEKDIEMGKTL